MPLDIRRFDLEVLEELNAFIKEGSIIHAAEVDVLVREVNAAYASFDAAAMVEIVARLERSDDPRLVPALWARVGDHDGYPEHDHVKRVRWVYNHMVKVILPAIDKCYEHHLGRQSSGKSGVQESQ